MTLGLALRSQTFTKGTPSNLPVAVGDVVVAGNGGGLVGAPDELKAVWQSSLCIQGD